VDEAIDLQVGLGDEATVELDGGRRLAKPVAQPQGSLVGQAMGKAVIGSKLSVRDVILSRLVGSHHSSGRLAIRNVT
jgi:hypothetical protein